ncbi:MAG TPA: prepilin-type N-terminal cleavage/methylation domain-containing protein [bacterium]|jgi:prepilin-type N-terminal cleavage/methylation domain-containing protein|nr:MAG: hypothetical protein BWX82_00731 [Parcubacteria group bacterium ADurb.Bin115]HQL34921.1 prepilin-type N-terminal cleavage/methylation domain-containing protein [bacterium]HQQ38598.1 prepilin-type N-terminal cleavage/methylation domain-containing protein [bacterium]
MIGNKDRKVSLKTGFTLIELVVSLSIISILTALFLVNYHSTNQRTDLTMSAQTLVTNIRFAQANALGLVKYDGEIPPGGWGVFVSSGSGSNHSYFIFADENDNRKYDNGEAIPALGGNVISLSPNISIDSLSLGNVEVSQANVTFLPPDPITRLESGSATSTFMDIRLRESLNNTTKTVRVNFLGLVEVID